MIGDFTVFLESQGTHNKIIQLCIVQIQRLLTWHCLYYLGSKGILRILHTPYKTTSWFAPWYSWCSHHFLITMAVIPDYVSDHMKLRSTFISCTLILIRQLGSRKSSSAPAGNHRHWQNPCTLTSSLNVLFTSCPVWTLVPRKLFPLHLL